MFHPVICSIRLGPLVKPSKSRKKVDSSSIVLSNTLSSISSHSRSNEAESDQIDQHASIGADIQALQKQLLQVDKRLNTLTNKLEVLRAVQQVLPAAKGPGGNPASVELSSREEPDSLEPSTAIGTLPLAKTSSSAMTEVGTIRSSEANVYSDRDLLALLRLERMAQQATQRDYEALRKQYQRLKEELEWRDSGHGDDLTELIDDSLVSGDRDRDSDSVQMKPTVALKSWTWRSAQSSRQSAVTTTHRHQQQQHRRHHHLNSRGDNSGSTCSSLESLATSEQLWNELQAREKTIIQLRSRIAQLEPLATSSRAEADRLDMINKELERKNQELQMIINNLTANVEALKQYQLVEQEKEDKTFVSSDEHIQRKRTYKVNENKEFIQMRELITELQQKETDYKTKIEQLERVLKQSNSLPEVPNLEELERHVNHVEKELEEKDKHLIALDNYLTAKEEECASLKMDLETLHEENIHLKQELDEVLFRDQMESTQKLEEINHELNLALEANKRLLEDINRERVLRKKYFNAVEDLKGKIRVYCRLRPLTESEQRTQRAQQLGPVADILDPYTVLINTSKGAKEFHFDRVFSPDDDQETVFEDTHTLVQSAFDGYNVCIAAYGQTGSGKTHTIIGEDGQPGLAPRTFQRIFQLANEHQAQFDVQVSCSMLELYNDRLIDLIRGDHPEVKLEIKKDKRGVVWVQGSRIAAVRNAVHLSEIFQHGLLSRHTGSTRMNDRSSRSHLIVAINITCTSRLHGTVLSGKVSLLDLAGSERFAKSGASTDQLREASSINKSLSTLGDVISALASDQQHTPYRNSKLTMLMQDSLGGNAKTLLFVTASIAHYNLDETLTSLTYASRAKEVTNAAQRNADNKEIARLKAIIQKLRRGDTDVENEPI